MPQTTFLFVYFFYGLSFFTMSVVISLEVRRCSDSRLRLALYFLAGFGIIHGAFEWMDLFQNMCSLATALRGSLSWESLHLVILAISFVLLSIFGSTLLTPKENNLRINVFVPLILVFVWSVGLLILSRNFPLSAGFWQVGDVWTRYVLAIPSALLACLGLIMQQREFRRVGMAQFGQDSLWAAVAFGWYGLVGQVFTSPSPLPPSNVLNTALFMQVFGFPVQILRALSALAVAVFVIRFLRSFEVETQRHIEELKAAQLEAAERRDALRGEFLHRVVAAQEAERQRIARELHDETGQALTGIGLGLRGITSQLHQDPEKAAMNLKRLEGMAAQSIEELQRLIADLRPSHLDDLGLPAALRWYCGELQTRVPLQVSLEILGRDQEIQPEMKITLFRVVQEALTNVIRHSQAAHATVRLYFQPKSVSVQVEDDGVGFDTSLIMDRRHPSWGLMGMEERASLLGGTLSLRSSPGKGTLVVVTIPSDQIPDNEVNNGDSLSIGG
jgi:signal transduction histidine kinase